MMTRLASEARRMCARHPDRTAVQLRRTTEKAGAGEYIATRGECDECAKRKAGGTIIPLAR